MATTVPPNDSAGAPGRGEKLFRTAVAFWLILAVIIGILVAHDPAKSTVNIYYHDATDAWMARANMYTRGHLAMNYLPHFAILYSVFHLLPLPVGDLLWQLGSIALFVTGVWRMVKHLFSENARRMFYWVTLFTIPLSAAAARNGQANMLVAALMLHAAASIRMENWWLAGGLILLALIAKPVAIVFALLALVFYPRLWLPMAAFAVPMAVFPYFFAGPEYVTSQYREFWINIQSCAAVDEYDYADISGILFPFHIQLSPQSSQILRAVAALGTLGLWLWGARKMKESLRAFWLMTLTGVYLMLFNPMTESNSYVILAPVLAIWAAFFLLRGMRLLGWGIAAMTLSMGLLPNLFRPVFKNHMAMFYHPLMTVIFLITIVICVRAEKSPAFESLRA